MEVPAMSFIVKRLGVLLTEEAKFLYGVSDQVEQIRVELNRMQCFLQDADYVIQSDLVDARVSNWLADIRKLAYETEDILETFVVQVSSKTGFRNTLKRFACIFNEWIDVHRVGSEIGAIKSKITDLTASLHTCGLKSIDSGVLDTNMEALGRKMVKLCAGLPLAIVVLGGLLATKHMGDGIPKCSFT